MALHTFKDGVEYVVVNFNNPWSDTKSLFYDLVGGYGYRVDDPDKWRYYLEWVMTDTKTRVLKNTVSDWSKVTTVIRLLPQQQNWDDITK